MLCQELSLAPRLCQSGNSPFLEGTGVLRPEVVCAEPTQLWGVDQWRENCPRPPPAPASHRAQGPLNGFTPLWSTYLSKALQSSWVWWFL